MSMNENDELRFESACAKGCSLGPVLQLVGERTMFARYSNVYSVHTVYIVSTVHNVYIAHTSE